MKSSVQLPKGIGGEYKGETQYTRYKKFINDILKVIRKGEVDYAYYIYQIEDLLRYEPNLKTKYVRDNSDFSYFEVWL